MMRKRDVAVQAVTVIVAFGVGILIGRASCAPRPEVVTETVTETVVEPRPEVVFQCPPKWQGPLPPKEPGIDATTVDRDRKLPDATKPRDPLERQRLLAWVRDQSTDLEGCRPGGTQVYRLAVTLTLDDDGRVRRVHLNAPPGEVPSNVRSCLRTRMSRWTPPDQLVEGRSELLFGLTI